MRHYFWSSGGHLVESLQPVLQAYVMVERNVVANKVEARNTELTPMILAGYKVCHLVNDGELGGSLRSHDDHPFVWHGECVVAA